MHNLKLYNLFRTAHIQTDKYFFECIFDSKKIIKKNEYDTITHLISSSNGKTNIHSSRIFEWSGRYLLDDYCVLLSVMQWNYIHYWNPNGLPLLNPINDFELFQASEVWLFLDQASNTLTLYHLSNTPLWKTISRAVLLYYEAKYLLIYHESQEIVMMHLFEFLISSIYRIDKNIDETVDVKLQDAFSHICSKHQYQVYINRKLKKEISPKKLSNFRKERGVKNLSSFTDQFLSMRNWVQHWKQNKKPLLSPSPSDSEFTFFYRLESFIRIVIADELWFKDYVRKFDILYQLLLEMNVNPTFTTESSKLRFIEKEKLEW